MGRAGRRVLFRETEITEADNVTNKNKGEG